jgi:hypothetical protein
VLPDAFAGDPHRLTHSRARRRSLPH